MDGFSYNSFPALDDDDHVILEYIAVETDRISISTKTYVVDKEPLTVADCPLKYLMQYDTYECKQPCPEMMLRPVAMFRDPFRRGRCKIVLCDLLYPDETVPVVNTRVPCEKVLSDEHIQREDVWVGFEQEYYFVDKDGRPFDWHLKLEDNDFDCNNSLFMGRSVQVQRQLVEAHLRACLYAGLSVGGVNREVSPSEWEYQLGPLPVLECADQLLVSRYILMRIAETNGVDITFFNPDSVKLFDSRCTLHVNLSSHNMRQSGGIEYIQKAIEKLELAPQKKLLKHYDLKDGADAEWRLSGEAYMPVHDKFVVKTGGKDGCSIRIPSLVEKQGCGYFEDRRPSSEADPYAMCMALTRAAFL